MKRAHKKRLPEATRRVPYVTCPDCGKRAYASRRDARGEARRQSDKGLSAYRCRLRTTEQPMSWHVGHATAERIVHLRNSEEWT